MITVSLTNGTELNFSSYKSAKLYLLSLGDVFFDELSGKAWLGLLTGNYRQIGRIVQ